ncbi:hypothetical protein [Actinophytocola sp.]|uniref:OsmC family protein n=1 Tax=Actinophytocola sp. TaxID=1872138 RepID=UPI002ED8EA1E
MRNSFYTAGFSEVMHEVKEDPAEAAYRYTASATASPLRGLTATIGPALFGTVKSARNLSVALAADGEDGPRPMDLALTGIAACGVTTLLGGGSAQEIIFDAAEMVISYDTGSVRCLLEIDGAADRDRLATLVEQMRGFSPNMATMTLAVPMALRREADKRTEDVGDVEAELTPAPTARRVRWISSTQLESHPADAPGAVALRVDQPKQLTGVDWGPNPQEYLVMGLAADVAAHLYRLTAQLTGERHTWEVRTSACEDMRGLLLKELDFVFLQDVECTVVVPAALRDDAVTDKIVRTAFARSAVRDLITRPHPPAVDLVHVGDEVVP